MQMQLLRLLRKSGLELALVHRWTPSDCCQKDDQRLAGADGDDANDDVADYTAVDDEDLMTKKQTWTFPLHRWWSSYCCDPDDAADDGDDDGDDDRNGDDGVDDVDEDNDGDDTMTKKQTWTRPLAQVVIIFWPWQVFDEQDDREFERKKVFQGGWS